MGHHDRFNYYLSNGLPMNRKQRRQRLKHLNQQKKFNLPGVRRKRHAIQTLEDLLLEQTNRPQHYNPRRDTYGFLAGPVGRGKTYQQQFLGYIDNVTIKEIIS